MRLRGRPAAPFPLAGLRLRDPGSLRLCGRSSAVVRLRAAALLCAARGCGNISLFAGRTVRACVCVEPCCRYCAVSRPYGCDLALEFARGRVGCVCVGLRQAQDTYGTLPVTLEVFCGSIRRPHTVALPFSLWRRVRDGCRWPGAFHGLGFFAYGRPRRSVHYHATTTSGQGTGRRLLRLRGEAGVTRGTTVVVTDVVAT